MTLRPELDCFTHSHPPRKHYSSLLSLEHTLCVWINPLIPSGEHRLCTKLEKFSQKVLSIPGWFSLTQEVLSMVIYGTWFFLNAQLIRATNVRIPGLRLPFSNLAKPKSLDLETHTPSLSLGSVTV